MINIILVTKNELELFRELLPEDYEFGRKDEYLLGSFTEDGIACGVLHYRFSDYRYEVLYMGIHPAFRRRGYGTELMRRFLDSTYGSGIVYPVFISYEESSFTSFDEMLKSMKCFYFDEETTIFRISESCRNSSDACRRFLKTKDECKLFFDQPEVAQKRFLSLQKHSGLPFLDDFESRRDSYCEELCFCVSRDNNIGSAVFCSLDEDQNIIMEYVYSNDSAGRALNDMFSAVAKAIDRDYKNRDLYIHAINDLSYSICCKIFGDEAERIAVKEAEWDFS